MPDLSRLGWVDEDLISYRDLARRTGHGLDWARNLLRGLEPFSVEPGQFGVARKRFRWSEVKLRLEEYYAEGLNQQKRTAHRIEDLARAWRARRGDGTGGQGTGGASDPRAI